MTEPIAAIAAIGAPPSWAILQRRLIHELSVSVHDFLDRFVGADDRLIWGSDAGAGDSADDFWEPYFNWPLLYALGGHDELRDISRRAFTAVSGQLEDLGALHMGYEAASDQFHQSEANTFLANLLCIAAADEELKRYAAGIAGFFLPGAPTANVDEDHRIYRSTVLGSEGPSPWSRYEPVFEWRHDMRVYGLPFDDVEGIEAYDDLKDPVLAARMAAVLEERFSSGDTISNLLLTGLLLLGALSSTEGDREAFESWLREYVDMWSSRVTGDGLVADNVGPRGEVGELFDGRWYGGLYGWGWPHGYHSVGMAVSVGACNALLTGAPDTSADFARGVHRQVLARAEMRDPSREQMSLRNHFPVLRGLADGEMTLLTPYRVGKNGWWDWHPIRLGPLVAIWNLTGKDEDRALIREMHSRSGEDWTRYVDFKTVTDSGHEAPWIAFLDGANAEYPEQALRHALGEVAVQRNRIRADATDLTDVPPDELGWRVHHWQMHNPVTTEALVQLTTGGAQALYNGGPHVGVVRHFDAEHRRWGLAPDVAALVTEISEHSVTLQLANTHPIESRQAGIVAGWYGQHSFSNGTWRAASPPAVVDFMYPGAQPEYELPGLAPMLSGSFEVQAGHVVLLLGPSSVIEVTLGLVRLVRPPSLEPIAGMSP